MMLMLTFFFFAFRFSRLYADTYTALLMALPILAALR